VDKGSNYPLIFKGLNQAVRMLIKVLMHDSSASSSTIFQILFHYPLHPTVFKHLFSDRAHFFMDVTGLLYT
jgi:hypothetical protein